MRDNNQDLDTLRKSLPKETPRVLIYIDPDGVRLKKPEGIIVEIWKRSKDVDGWDHIETLDTNEYDNLKR